MEFWQGKKPFRCHFCGCKIGTAFVDGKHKNSGKWHIFCMLCYRSFGSGYGPLKGHLYEQVKNKLTLTRGSIDEDRAKQDVKPTVRRDRKARRA